MLPPLYHWCGCHCLTCTSLLAPVTALIVFSYSLPVLARAAAMPLPQLQLCFCHCLLAVQQQLCQCHCYNIMMMWQTSPGGCVLLSVMVVLPWFCGSCAWWCCNQLYPSLPLLPLPLPSPIQHCHNNHPSLSPSIAITIHCLSIDSSCHCHHQLLPLTVFHCNWPSPLTIDHSHIHHPWLIITLFFKFFSLLSVQLFYDDCCSSFINYHSMFIIHCCHCYDCCCFFCCAEILHAVFSFLERNMIPSVRAIQWVQVGYCILQKWIWFASSLLSYSWVQPGTSKWSCTVWICRIKILQRILGLP